MLKAIYGDGKAGKKEFTTPKGVSPTQDLAIVEGQARPLTPAAFDAMFGASRPRKFVVPTQGPVKEVG